jgi:hypothetical protein
MCELVLVSGSSAVHSGTRDGSTPMRPLSARPPVVRLPRCVGTSWALLAVLCASTPSCFGGQTGTEATPSRDKGASNTPSTGETGGSYAADGSATAATGAESACNGDAIAVGQLQAQTGLSANAVIDFVSGVNPFTLRYADQSVAYGSLQLTLLTNSCVATANSGPSSLNVPVTVQLTSDDGRINLGLSGWAEAHAAAAAGVGDVDLTATLQCDRNLGTDGMAACAIAGIDEAAYALIGIDLSTRMQSVDGTMQLLGILRISGSSTGTCSPEPCSVTDWVTVSSISLSSGL